MQNNSSFTTPKPSSFQEEKTQQAAHHCTKLELQA
jgi:hypothetical protein